MSVSTAQPGISDEDRTPAPQRPRALTIRALLIGILFTALTDLWIHWAELVLGARGHTALANTAIPVGAFNVLFLLITINIILTKFLRPLAFSRGELLVIYCMLTVSTVVSSSGGIHFVVPTIAAAFYYASSSNGWAGLFHKYIPGWIAQKNPAALYGFYVGNQKVPWAEWWPQIASWVGFLILFTLAALCIVAILRKQWIDRERLAFPTVAVPVEMIRDGPAFFQNRLLWIGFALAFGVDILNTLHLNIPTVPYIPTRTTDQPDLVNYLNAPPWNAIGPTPISFYPFVIGIAYLLSVEMTFSCWFFWLVTKAEAVFGEATGITAGATGGGQSAFPYIGHQGAGAFLALTLVGLYLSRGYLKEVWQTAFGRKSTANGRIPPRRHGDTEVARSGQNPNPESGLGVLCASAVESPLRPNAQRPTPDSGPTPYTLHPTPLDSDEPMSYRVAIIGLIVCVAAMLIWCMAAGMRGIVAAALILLALLYMIAAARIRAETGNAWLFGPAVDAYQVMTTTFGTTVYRPADLTILAYLRSAIANFDLRCLSMPNQFDAYKMADALKVEKRRLTVALVVAIVLGIAISFAIALMIWYSFGAGAKTDSWRTMMGKQPFDQLSDALKTPVKTDTQGTLAIGAGFLITAILMALRGAFNWWIFHPVGYAMANTNTMNQVWLPFFIAWLVKVTVLRYGGMRLYRNSLPFFYGLIVGDFLAGGLTTLAGCFFGISPYPINW